MSEQAVTLTLPAKAQYMVHVRLVCAAMAGQAGFDVEKIEDVKTAVAEACLMLLPDAGQEDFFTIRLWENAGLWARVAGPTPGSQVRTSEQEMGAFLLEALADEVSCTEERGETLYLLRWMTAERE